jgi:hypothetical protein
MWLEVVFLALTCIESIIKKIKVVFLCETRFFYFTKNRCANIKCHDVDLIFFK